MKKLLTTLLIVAALTVFLGPTFGQTGQTLKKVSDDRLVSVLNDLSILSEKKTNELSIRIFKVGNPSGSAGGPTSEITHNIYIAVSEFDEAPEQSLYFYGPMYNPQVLGWTGQDSVPILNLDCGPANSRKQLKLKISLASVTVLK